MATKPLLPLVWVDLEMTGLDLAKDHIMEAACIITDGELNELETVGPLVLSVPDSALAGMDTWCQEHHGASGLTAACAASRTTVAEAESLLLAAVRRWAPQAGEAVLAGSSVHADRGFLARDMKALVGHLHYRIVDVSSIKELLRRWDPRLLEQAPAKTSQHRALSDIRESIAELQFYREHAFAAGVRQMS